MGGQGRVIERTLYTDIVNGLKKLGFDAYSESKAGTGRDFPDVICIYNEKKIVIEVKFGNIEQNNPNIPNTKHYNASYKRCANTCRFYI